MPFSTLYSFPTRRSSDLPNEFVQHAAFLGGSGSGKTTAALNLIEQLLDQVQRRRDRKSTRLNSSHSQISYAVFGPQKKYDVNTARDRQNVLFGDLDGVAK